MFEARAKRIVEVSYKMRRLLAENRAWQEDVDRKWREVERCVTPRPGDAQREVA